MSTRPLDGTIVLDLTTALAGPYATLLLAGLGARVIKIENPLTGGDSSRGNSPYVTREGLRLRRLDEVDMSLSMMLRGRGKESLTINLRTDEGRALLKELAAHADVLVENYSAGVTERLGIDHPRLRETNPRLVYTSISGFGAQGLPEGGGKAMDTIIQALSGLMMTAGQPDDPPVRLGVPVGDLVAPLFAVIGTLAAVLQARTTGHGQHVDVSMLGALTSLVAAEPFDALESVGIPLRTGPLVPRLAPFGTFESKNGWIALCAPTDALAASVLRAVGREDLLTEDRFATRDARVANADALHAIIGDWIRSRTNEEALSGLVAGGVPAAPVRSTAEAVRDPLLLTRGEVVPLSHPEYGEVADVYGSGIPFRLSGSDTTLDRPAPALSQDTERVLKEFLDYDARTVDELRRSGVI
ncbi:crotonobetainyl-CoA:carnitine CoA-transferase CaiB-like acyl-CoA transferase [Streptosporangium becharense]|uniref:Crotonobetainyl-CoA:carnitine CoA-transferase CaiB-like acyl-CoA transferase n=1 Tax=Streptosporangium becharense TaxID=1816182 RepID=A0A7W9ME53_9ACTN|nr:CoA transferase [Streptosporangium becharense]MBB2914064.1 crotonobetainyl-CoA:carnitine CoA-transferase CaiB-like acyl-CoA transferase [Streptosporangium becharense]MBB5817091.1 crotonobetainyl-CoA:carnitine CoA-transferase CaiB-like acyl-CoA transferase [Streptosporangium becharense]